MPRRKRIDKRRAALSLVQWAFLNDIETETSFELLALECDCSPFYKVRDLWEKHHDDVLAEYFAERPGTRPRLWWKFSSPRMLGSQFSQPRERLGGIGKPCPYEGTNYDWNEGYIGIPRRFYGVDPNDPPVYESQAVYSDRLGLFAIGERKRLRKAYFEAETVS